jgi:hypothetical protein
VLWLELRWNQTGTFPLQEVANRATYSKPDISVDLLSGELIVTGYVVETINRVGTRPMTLEPEGLFPHHNLGRCGEGN